MHNYDLGRAAAIARGISYETDISMARNSASDITYNINRADSYITELENDLANARRTASEEKEKNDLLEQENERLKKELENANKLNEALMARIALKEIYSKTGSHWYIVEGSELASKIRNSVAEFEKNNGIDIKMKEVADFNSAYEKIEIDNEKHRDNKRKNTAMAFIKIAEIELTMEAVSEANDKINLVQDKIVKKALLGELYTIERRVKSKLRISGVVSGIKNLIKTK